MYLKKDSEHSGLLENLSELFGELFAKILRVSLLLDFAYFNGPLIIGHVLQILPRQDSFETVDQHVHHRLQIILPP